MILMNTYNIHVLLTTYSLTQAAQNYCSRTLLCAVLLFFSTQLNQLTSVIIQSCRQRLTTKSWEGLFYELTESEIWAALGRLDSLRHGLRTPNEGINQRYLKNWADVADKYASAVPKNLGLGLNFRQCSEGYFLSVCP